MEERRELARTLGLTDVVSIVMSAIIGVGIFFAPSQVMAKTGSEAVALAAWIVGGVIAIVGSLTFAELGGLLPRTGGQYLVLRESYGPFAAFSYCWALIAVIQSGAFGIIALVCVEYLLAFAGAEVSTPTVAWLTVGLIAVLTSVNVLGVRGGALLAKGTMVIKALTLLSIAGLGLVFGGEAAQRVVPGEAAAAGGWWLILPALTPVLFTTAGWQQALYIGGEVRDPGRTLPRGIIFGVAGVVALYLAANLGYVALLGGAEMAESRALAVDAVAVALPGLAEKVVALAVAVSAFGIANVCVLTAPRMYKAMADAGDFFAVMGRVSPRFGTPDVAVWVQGAVAAALVLALGKGGVDRLLTGVVCIDWIFFLLTGIALFVLRAKMPDAERPFRVPGYPVLPALFVIAAVFVIVGTFLDPTTRSASVIAVGVLATGGVAYLVARRRSPG